MTIREITVKELPDFIDSALYKGSHYVPLTPERLCSQVNNPRAQPGDTVLIVAYADDGQLAGFAGMLPDNGNGAGGPYRFAWNSGWWIDPVLGKGIALKIFYRSLQTWKGHFLITDLTPHTREIIELTRLFYFSDPYHGVRLQILSDFSGKLMRKYKFFKAFRGLLTLIDKPANSILRYRLDRWMKKNNTEGLKIEYIQHPDDESLSFIGNHSRQELCRRGKPEFEWIMSYPWLVCGKSDGMTGKYPFSRECRHFEYIMAKILYREKISGFVLITNREGLFKIPYGYFEPSRVSLFSNAVCRILIDKNAAGFCTFRNEIRDYIEKNAFPVFYKNNMERELAVSKTISQMQPEKFFLQDGDGDVVFT